MIRFLLYLTICQLFACKNIPTEPIESMFFVGAYTNEEYGAQGKGISTCFISTNTGEMRLAHVFEKSKDPSYVVVHPNRKWLYAANETGGSLPGYISAYEIQPDGSLTFLDEKYTMGDHPCHLAIAPDHKHLLVANYSGGSVALFALLENGALGDLPAVVKHSGSGPFEERQAAPHAHFFGPGINDSSAFAVDLGTDQIFHYRLTANGRLGITSVTRVAPGTGPRHLVFHPTLKSCYVLTEFNNKVEAFAYVDEKQPFTRYQTIGTLADELPFYTSTSSAIKIHPTGKFLYAANRGIPDTEEDNIARFAVHPQNGQLTFMGTVGTAGKVPRDFEMHPAGKLLIAANQKTGNLVSFWISAETGELTPTGHQLAVGTPTCVKFW